MLDDVRRDINHIHLLCQAVRQLPAEHHPRARLVRLAPTILHNGPIELHVDLAVEAMFGGSCFSCFQFRRKQFREDEALLWPRGGHEEIKRNFETILRLCVV